MFLPLADATAQPGVLGVVMALGFLIGTYGHIAKSKTLILTGILIIALISAYFVIESQVGHPLPFP